MSADDANDELFNMSHVKTLKRDQKMKIFIECKSS